MTIHCDLCEKKIEDIKDMLIPRRNNVLLSEHYHVQCYRKHVREQLGSDALRIVDETTLRRMTVPSPIIIEDIDDAGKLAKLASNEQKARELRGMINRTTRDVLGY